MFILLLSPFCHEIRMVVPIDLRHDLLYLSVENLLLEEAADLSEEKVHPNYLPNVLRASRNYNQCHVLILEDFCYVFVMLLVLVAVRQLLLLQLARALENLCSKIDILQLAD